MKPCAHVEALEDLALRGDRGRGTNEHTDAWLEAHVTECEQCAAELDRLLEERELFVRRARVLDVALEPSGVFAVLDRRRERFRKSGVLASMVAAAAACVAMAFAPVTAIGVRAGLRAGTEPAQADLGATAAGGSWDEAPMTMRVAACMPPGIDHTACDAPMETRTASGGMSMSMMNAATACVADVTCSVARP